MAYMLDGQFVDKGTPGAVQVDAELFDIDPEFVSWVDAGAAKMTTSESVAFLVIKSKGGERVEIEEAALKALVADMVKTTLAEELPKREESIAEKVLAGLPDALKVLEAEAPEAEAEEKKPKAGDGDGKGTSVEDETAEIERLTREIAEEQKTAEALAELEEKFASGEIVPEADADADSSGDAEIDAEDVEDESIDDVLSDDDDEAAA